MVMQMGKRLDETDMVWWLNMQHVITEKMLDTMWRELEKAIENRSKRETVW